MDRDGTTDAAASSSEGARQGSTATAGAISGAGRGLTAMAGATNGAGEGSTAMAGATDTDNLLEAVRSVVQQELHTALPGTGTGGGEHQQPDHLHQLH